MTERPILMSAPMVTAARRVVDPKTVTRRILNPQPQSPRCIYDSEGADTIVKAHARGSAWKPPYGRPCSAFSFSWSMTKINETPCVHRDATYADWLCPYGQPGDRLWVKETWASVVGYDKKKPTTIHESAPIFYRADGIVDDARQVGAWLVGKWRPSIFMMRWMSRLTLEITAIHVERLHDITEEQAVAEGVTASWLPAMNLVVLDDGSTFEVADGYVHGVPRVGENWHGYNVTHVQHRPAVQQFSARDNFRALWCSLNGPESWGANPWVWVVEFKRVDQGAPQ